MMRPPSLRLSARKIARTTQAAALAGLAAWSLAGCSKPEPPPEIKSYRQVDAFSFTDQNGESFTSDGLAGKVWIANFVFTSCNAECIVLSRRMAVLQEHYADRAADVGFVSFSVDPQTDTPERLLKYARRNEAKPGWSFLTGDPDAIDTLVKTSFLLPVTREPKERASLLLDSIIHSDRLAVVDRSGTVRFYQSGLAPDAVDRLVIVVDALLAERS